MSSKAHKMSSTSFRWRHLVNACEVGPPDRTVSSTWRRLFLAAYPSGLNLVVVAVLRDSVCVIAALRGRLLSYIVKVKTNKTKIIILLYRFI